LKIDIEFEVKRKLEEWGFKVQKIKETKKKTPDFLCIKDNQFYIIELKTKYPNPELKNKRSQTLQSGYLFDNISPLIRNKQLSQIIQNSIKQLKSDQKIPDPFRIVWLHCEGFNSETHFYQYKSSLYGLMTIFPLEQEHLYDCYYFTSSDFYKYKDTLDGAIISYPGNLLICVNNLSVRYSGFKISPLIKMFNNKHLDPINEEIKGIALIVDSSIDRNNPNEVIKFLEDKYKLGRLTPMPMKHVTATTSVNKNE